MAGAFRGNETNFQAERASELHALVSTVPGRREFKLQFCNISTYSLIALLLSAGLSLLMLSGCSSGMVMNSGATSTTAGLVASPSSLDYGTLTVGQSASQTAAVINSSQQPVVISSVSVTDPSFKITDKLTLPMTLPAGSSLSLHIVFHPTVAADTSAQVLVSAGSSTQANAQVQRASQGSGGGGTSINLKGSGKWASTTAPAVIGLSCTSASFSGSGTDSCTVNLNAPAPGGGWTVALSSDNASVTVPSSVKVSTNNTSATFSASIAAVTTAQTANLQASAGGGTASFAIQLNTPATATPVAALSANATSISFGSVNLNTPSTQSVVLSSTGTQAVTVSGATVTGAGFSITGATFPITLNPGQSTTLSVQFDPTTTGTVTGQLTITSNSSSSSTLLIALSGTGQSTSHSVTLTWDAPTNSSDPVAGYNVYRTSGGSTSYQLLNSTQASQTTYVDGTVQSGQTYDYVVRSVDASGVESSPSNMTAATVP